MGISLLWSDWMCVYFSVLLHVKYSCSKMHPETNDSLSSLATSKPLSTFVMRKRLRCTIHIHYIQYGVQLIWIVNILENKCISKCKLYSVYTHCTYEATIILPTTFHFQFSPTLLNCKTPWLQLNEWEYGKIMCKHIVHTFELGYVLFLYFVRLTVRV